MISNRRAGILFSRWFSSTLLAICLTLTVLALWYGRPMMALWVLPGLLVAGVITVMAFFVWQPDPNDQRR